nr:hypothetical protein Iba_scaffold2499CG0040 [Ipomoea batatas]
MVENVSIMTMKMVDNGRRSEEHCCFLEKMVQGLWSSSHRRRCWSRREAEVQDQTEGRRNFLGCMAPFLVVSDDDGWSVLGDGDGWSVLGDDNGWSRTGLGLSMAEESEDEECEDAEVDWHAMCIYSKSLVLVRFNIKKKHSSPQLGWTIERATSKLKKAAKKIIVQTCGSFSQGTALLLLAPPLVLLLVHNNTAVVQELRHLAIPDFQATNIFVKYKLPKLTLSFNCVSSALSLNPF